MFTVPSLRAPVKSAGTSVLSELPLVEVNTLTVATTQPVPAKKLARMAGYKANSYFRAAVRHLIVAGLLLRLPDGLCLPRTSQQIVQASAPPAAVAVQYRSAGDYARNAPDEYFAGVALG